VRLNKDQTWIRFDWSCLTEIVVDHTPGPNILLGGDVERNPGPPRFSMQHGVTEYTHVELEEMKRWQIDKINERLQDANDVRTDLNHRHPLVLHRGDHESEEFQSIFQYEVPAYTREAMTNLAVLSEVAEPSFLLMIKRVETSFENVENASKLQEYGPLATHLINCLMGIIDISQEQSLHMMLMTCVQQKMRQMHDTDARSTASMAIHLKMTSSEFLANVVRLGLMRGSMQVEIGDLCSAMEAAGRTTRSQVQDQLWTAESVRDTLTGWDTLGLGGASWAGFHAQALHPSQR
jgi:hypothetical protein